MSNTFWASFYGAAVGTLVVYLINQVIETVRLYRDNRYWNAGWEACECNSDYDD
jgi:hypothetical protein